MHSDKPLFPFQRDMLNRIKHGIPKGQISLIYGGRCAGKRNIFQIVADEVASNVSAH